MKRKRQGNGESFVSKAAKTLTQTSWMKAPKGLAEGVTSTIVGEHRYLRGIGAQAEMFRLADIEGHKVSIALEIFGTRGTRQFTSFLNYNTFLNYYETFEGQRCFYTIDRSYSVVSATSLLHMDIEWYSEDEGPDNQYEEKIELIVAAVRTSLPGDKHVEVLHEDLSRYLEPNTWYNSAHLYFQTTFAHNADGCMRQFIDEIVQSKLKDNELMYCP